ADLKTISLLGSYGMTALTALTAQNSCGVKGTLAVPADFVTDQIKAVLSDLGADVVKTGMLDSASIVHAVAEAIRRYALMTVVDPVMMAKGGASLLKNDAVEVLRSELLPRTYLLTPNLPEAEALAETPVRSPQDMEKAARKLQRMGARNVLIKGGHLEGEPLDLLLEGRRFYRFSSPRIETSNTHGTGCTYSAAIATFLAQGQPLVKAVATAKRFMNEAIRTAVTMGSGHGPVNHFQAASSILHQPARTGEKETGS
ncbi:MAG TPA: bifunctional hydroxymethylpyrimidine kinase/phosphomethylpyrimidine kinase, partial [Desulfuromonadales bacterium]|nr:bifunctional hydroxymethylpyrimidine kinase/phosphomethylpyrimidine kinase [Desulfuromonadales bacterium]